MASGALRFSASSGFIQQDVATSTWVSDILAKTAPVVTLLYQRTSPLDTTCLQHEYLALMSACSLKSTHSGISSIDAGIFNVYLGNESNAAYVPPVGDDYSGLNDLKRCRIAGRS
ncbi:hypothetical protein IW262DRAFT_1298441 [Armillaria fumosa]|nr:hypothetical protein IW262DRAFT_1298441 [Armillaria fumosa]